MLSERNDFFAVLRRQFEPSLEMLEKLVEYCPDEKWREVNGGFPFWQQLYHALIGVEFWFRLEKGQFNLPDFGKDVTPDLDFMPKDFLTKEEMKQYINKMKNKSDRFFEAVENRLLEANFVYGGITNADVILMQIRHIQYHVGHCNSILRHHGIKAVEWMGYGE